MVFFEERLAFLSVPKTGSTAYQAVLRHRADLVVMEPPELKHATVQVYNRFFRPMYTRICDTDLELIAVMRHPVSWLGSWWRYRQRPDMKNPSNATHGISFDDFVLAYLKGKKPGYANVGSQAKFLKTQNNGVGVTHLFRYEDQDALKSFLNNRLGLNIQTERLNVSPDVPLQLSSHIEEKYRQKCSEEFEMYENIPERN